MFDIYTPTELYEVMFDPKQTVSTSAWLDKFFPNSHMSDQEEIMFDRIGASRPIAPFMLPNLQGQPIYRREGERIESFRPAYTKPKDAVKPSEALALQPGELVRRVGLQTPEARFDAEVVKITRYHRDAIQRLWDFMGAKAALDGAITINYANGQRVTIDFGRNPSHTIVKTAGSFWGEAGVSIFGDLQAWIDRVAEADFGGSVQDVVLGAKAAAAFLADSEIIAKLDKDTKGAEDIWINRGLVRVDPLNPFTLLGTLGSGVRVWRYAGVGAKFQNADRSFTDIMDPRDVFLAAPGLDGVKCFGAIQDIAYSLQPADIFSKMWDNEDPSARFIMSQSAPLMIPVNPNNTLRARVVA